MATRIAPTAAILWARTLDYARLAASSCIRRPGAAAGPDVRPIAGVSSLGSAHADGRVLATPLCPNPIQSTLNGDRLMSATLAIAERHNIIGVVSGSPERVARWAKPTRVASFAD